MANIADIWRGRDGIPVFKEVQAIQDPICVNIGFSALVLLIRDSNMDVDFTLPALGQKYILSENERVGETEAEFLWRMPKMAGPLLAYSD